MARGVNFAVVVGVVGRDPEVRYTGSNKAICNFSIATSEVWTKDGEKQEETTWHNVTLFGKAAEIAGEYLKKGMLAAVKGRIKKRKYQAKDGTEKEATEINADDFQFWDLPSKSERPYKPKGG